VNEIDAVPGPFEEPAPARLSALRPGWRGLTPRWPRSSRLGPASAPSECHREPDSWGAGTLVAAVCRGGASVPPAAGGWQYARKRRVDPSGIHYLSARMRPPRWRMHFTRPGCGRPATRSVHQRGPAGAARVPTRVSPPERHRRASRFRLALRSGASPAVAGGAAAAVSCAATHREQVLVQPAPAECSAGKRPRLRRSPQTPPHGRCRPGPPRRASPWGSRPAASLHALPAAWCLPTVSASGRAPPGRPAQANPLPGGRIGRPLKASGVSGGPAQRSRSRRADARNLTTGVYACGGVSERCRGLCGLLDAPRLDATSALRAYRFLLLGAPHRRAPGRL
jgi:hypothetical protein